MKKWIIIALLICTAKQCLLAQIEDDSTTYTPNRFIKTNPYKPFMGIASIGYESILYNSFSLSIFAEYMFRDSLIINGSEHPAFVFQMTPRYYISNHKILYGFFVGVMTGFTLKRKNANQPQGFVLGAESGYKFLLGKKKRFFLEPKVILTHNFSEQRVLIPGIEGHIGIRF
jgi:hypothetical protein